MSADGLARDTGAALALAEREPRSRRTLVILIAAAVIGTLMLGLVIRYSSYTFAYDYRAYDEAARRVLVGASPYDLSYTQAGPFGLFYYPPPSIFAFLPFTVLPVEVASWSWILLATAAVVTAIALMPVRLEVRAIVMLVAGISWPVLYAVKIGQIGPLLLLLFAVAWRWLDRPAVAGAAAAVGTALKLQPGILLVWMALSGRWRTLAFSVATLAVLALAATILLGPSVWLDFTRILTQVGDPIRTDNNFTPGSIAFRSGASVEVASAIQLVSMAVVAGSVVAAARILVPEAAFLVAVVASQMLSPILWDHYALILMLPVAWLLERRQWWAILIPLSESALLVGVTPPVGYTIAFAVVIVALIALGRSSREPQRTIVFAEVR